jgi:hypothetical protein
VTVREDPELAAEIGRRMETASGERPIGVTDLLTLRPAFWRMTSPPLPVSPARKRRLESGRRVHRALADLFAPEGSLEVRVRRPGFVGRIDVLTDRPVELKSASFAPEAEGLVEDRPEYVEQLAMYCALTDRPLGRLIMVVLGDEDRLEVRSLDVRFQNLGTVLFEMQRRAAMLRAAVAGAASRELPRCRWFDRGCEFREGPTCDCTGSEPDASSTILDEVVEVRPQHDADASLASRLQEALRIRRPSSIQRFRDLVYPRRAYFERRREAEPVKTELGPSPAPASELYARLIEALEGGPLGEVTRLSSLAKEPDEDVSAFRGVPYLVRTTRAWSVPRADQLVDQSPQYALELGFRCAATGSRYGRVIVAHERATDPQDRLKVFELHFDPVSRWARLWRVRAAGLSHALVEGAITELPACPTWMYADCPYRANCGCGEDPGRSHR